MAKFIYIISLYCLIFHFQSKSYSFEKTNKAQYFSILKDNSRIYIDLQAQHGFNIQLENNQKLHALHHTLIDGRQYFFNSDNKTINFYNIKAGKLIQFNTKDLGLYECYIPPAYRPIPDNFILGLAQLKPSNPNYALLLVDLNLLKVTTFVKKNTCFQLPILYKQNNYYGFAEKNKVPHIYQFCSKNKKINYFPINVKIEQFALTHSENEILGYGKIKPNSVLFKFNTKNHSLSITDITKLKKITNIKPISTFFENYRINNKYFHLKSLKNCPTILMNGIKSQQKKNFFWNINTNKIQELDCAPYLIHSSCRTINNDVIFDISITNNVLRINRFDLIHSKAQTLKLNNMKCNLVESFCDDKGTRVFLSSKHNQHLYLADFNCNTLKAIEPISQDLSRSLFIWTKDSLLILKNLMIKIPYLTLKPEKIKLPYEPLNPQNFDLRPCDYIAYPSPFIEIENSNRYNFLSHCYSIDLSYKEFFNFLQTPISKHCVLFDIYTNKAQTLPFIFFTNAYKKNKPWDIYGLIRTDVENPIKFNNLTHQKNKAHLLSTNFTVIAGNVNIKEGKAFILTAPQLNGQSVRIFSKLVKILTTEKSITFYEMNIDKKALLEYQISCTKPDNTYYCNKFLIVLTKKEKGALWIWMINTKNQMITTLKFPEKIPRGYFDLKQYTVNQTYASPLPNQKWHEVTLKSFATK